MPSFADLVLDVDASGVVKGNTALDQLIGKAEKAEGAVGSLGVAFKRASSLLAGFLTVNKIVEYANTWSDLQSRVGNAIGDMSKAPQVMDRLAASSRKTYSSLQITANAFADNASTMNDLKINTEGQLRFSEALNNALVISGATAERAASVQWALSTAMGQGKLQGDQLNTVLASGDRVAKALADQLGVTTLELRAQASAGKITADVIYNALLKSYDQLEQEAGDMPATIRDGFTIIGNSALQIVGTLDNITGASSTISSALIAVGDNLQLLASIGLATAAVFAGQFAVGMVQGVVSTAKQAYTEMVRLELALGATTAAEARSAVATKLLSGAFGTLKAALVTTGIGALVVALGYAINYMIDLSTKAGGFGNAIKLVYDAVAESFGRIPTLLEGLVLKWAAMQTTIYASAINFVASTLDVFLNLPTKMEEAFSWLTETIGTLFSNIGPIVGNALVSVAKIVLDKISDLVNKVISGFNTLIDWVNTIPGVAIDAIGSVNFGKLTDGVEGVVQAISSFDGQGMVDSLRTTAGGLQGIADKADAAGDASLAAATQPLASWENLQTVMNGTATATDTATTSVTNLNNNLDKTKKKADEAAKAAKELKEWAEGWKEKLDPTISYRKEMEKLAAAYKAGYLNADQYAAVQYQMNAELADSLPLVGKISDSFSEMIFSTEDGFQSLVDSFKDSLQQMIAEALKNKIVVGLGLNTTTTTGTTSSLTGASSSSGSSLVSTASTAMNAIKLATSNFMTGAWATISATWSSGLAGLTGSVSSAFSAMTSAASGFAAGTVSASTTLASLGTTLGAVAAPLAAVAAAVSFFSTKTKLLDSGLRVTISDNEALVETYKKIKKTKFWGLSSKTSTGYSTASSEVSDPITAAIYTAQASILSMASTLGVASSAFDDFSYTLKVSTKGLTDDEISKALEDALNDANDAYSLMIDGLDDLIETGETATDALTRLSTAITTVNGALDTLNYSFQYAGITGAAAADSLADLFGSTDDLTSSVSSYWDTFYSEAEQQAILTRQATTALAAYNVQLPTTRDAYRALIDAQDLSTESGRELWAALVQMSSVMDEILPTVANLTTELEALVSTASTSLTDAIDALTEAQKASAEAASNWYKVADSIEDYVSGLYSDTSSTISALQSYAYNQTKYLTQYEAALSGNLTAAQNITGYAASYLTSAKASAQTSAEYRLAQARVASQLSLLSGASDIEGAKYDVIAGLQQDQIDLMQDMSDYISAGNDLTSDMIEELQTQLSSLDDAISEAAEISYSKIKAALEVNVDLVADSDIPAYLKTLLTTENASIDKYVDFVTRSDLSADDKWIALTSSSTMNKTVTYLAKNNLGASLTSLALSASSEIRKTVNMVVGSTLDADTISIALANNSTATKTIYAVLSSDISKEAKKLALADVGLYSVTINAALSSSASNSVKKLLINNQSTYTALIDAAISSDMTATERRILLIQQGAYVANISAALGLNTVASQIIVNQGGKYLATISASWGNLTSEQQRTIIKSSGTYATTIFALWNSGLTTAQKNILWTQGGGYLVTIAAKWGSLSSAMQDALVDQYGSYLTTVRATWSTLTEAQKRTLWHQGGTYVATITAAVGKMTDSQKTVLFNAYTSAARSVTISAAFASSLTAEQKVALASASSQITRTINAIVNTGYLSEMQSAALTTATGTVTKTINGVINTGNLSSQQSALLNAISGSTNGYLTLGGSFQFDPSSGFSTLMSSSMEAPLKTAAAAMATLTNSLNALKSALTAQEQVSNANDIVSSVATTTDGKYYLTGYDISKLADIYGIDRTGKTTAQIAEAAAWSSGSDLLNPWNFVLDTDGSQQKRKAYLETELESAIANLKSIVAAVNEFDASTSGDLVNASGGLTSPYVTTSGEIYWTNGNPAAVSGADSAGLAAWKKTWWADNGLEDRMWDANSAVKTLKTKLAAYATGGQHSGGVALVGEEGPELINIGPSRVFNADQTSNILGSASGSGTDLSSLLTELQTLNVWTKKMALAAVNSDKLLRKQDNIGVKINPDQNTVTTS